MRRVIAIVAVLTLTGVAGSAAIAGSAGADTARRCGTVVGGAGTPYRATGVRTGDIKCSAAAPRLARWIEDGSKSFPTHPDKWHARGLGKGVWKISYGKKGEPWIIFAMSKISLPSSQPTPPPPPSPAPQPPTPALPAAPSITSGPPSPTNLTSATFVFDDTDRTVTFRCDLDGTSQACGIRDHVVSYGGLADGVHTFSVQAINAVGLATNSAPYVWRISTQGPPKPTLDQVTPATSPNNSTAITFVFSDSQTGASFMCALDGGAYQPCSSPKPYNDVSNGVHTFAVQAQDALGNVSSVAPYTWTTDTTPPTITAVLPTKGQTIQALGKVNANYSCADNLAVQSCVGTVANGSQLDTTTLGDHEFTVTATDTAGNRSTADLGYTVANNTLPTITIDGPTDAQSFNWNQSANAKYGCSSPVGVVSCVGTVTAAGTASDPAGTSTPVANGGALPMAGAPGPGTRTLTVTATDTYGGVSTKAVNYTVKPAGYYALTFDDGPNASFTQPILDELHQYGATAAFFLIGQNVAQYPALAKAEVDAGMTVGDHTWDHSAIAVDPSGGNPAPVPYTCPTAPPNRQPAANECAPWQLEDASDAIFNATGVRPHFFRPPYGSYDTGTIALLNSLPAPYNGMALAAWTTDTNDWAGATTSEIVQAALTVPSGGVILMHDAQQTTVVAVPQIITQMADTRGMLPGKLAVGGDWVGPFCGPAGDPCPPPFQPNWSVSAVAPAS